jgi:hypothetical protein
MAYSARSILTEMVFPYILDTYSWFCMSATPIGVSIIFKKKWGGTIIMPVQDQEDRKLKAEIDEIMKRVDRTVARIDSQDPGKLQKNDSSGQ